MTYFDSSALIKRFVVEEGTPLVQRLVGQDGGVATAKSTYAEIYSGLTRRRRGGDLSLKEYAAACRQFEEDWRAYLRVDLRDEVLLVARDLIQRYPLRGADAVHLASALDIKDGLGEEIGFAAADRRLLRAAQAERLQIVDVESADTW